MVLERYEDADKAFTEAIALGPTDPRLHENVSRTKEAFGRDPSFAPGPSTTASRPSRQVFTPTASVPREPLAFKGFRRCDPGCHPSPQSKSVRCKLFAHNCSFLFSELSELVLIQEGSQRR